MSFGGTSGGIDWWIETSISTLTVKPAVTPESGYEKGQMKHYSLGTAPWYPLTNPGYRLVIVDGVKNIGSWAFYGCYGVEHDVVIPASVTHFATGAFNTFYNVKNIYIYGDARPVSAFESGAFSMDDGKKMTHKIYSKDDWAKDVITDSIVSYTLFEYDSLASDWIIDGGIEYRKNSDTKLLEVRPTDTPEVGFTKGQMRDYGEGRTPWGTITDSGWSLTLYDGITNIGNNAFHNCTGFTNTLSIPNSVTKIGDGAFENCCNFISDILKLPDSLTYVGDSAFFYDHEFVGELVIPSGVTYIGYYAFMYISDLSSVRFLCDELPNRGAFALNAVAPEKTYIAYSNGWVTEDNLPDTYYTKWVRVVVPDNTVRIKLSDEWFNGKLYTKQDGAWVEGVPRYKTSGKWE